MRHVLLILILHLSITSFSQLRQPKGEQIVFADILSTKDTTTTKDEIYSRVLEWSGDAFNSSKAVIDVQDRQAGMIMLKAKMLVSYIVAMGMTETSYGDYAIKISIKNGRIKCEMGPFIMDNVNFPGCYVTSAKDCGYNGMGKRVIQRIWEAYQAKSYETHATLINSLTVSINNKKDW